MTLTSDDTNLGEFEGDPVLGTAIDIPNAGGGLHETMKTQPVILHRGQTVKVLLECEVKHVSHPGAKKDDGVIRTHRLSATNATIVDGEVFDKALAAQAEANQRRQDAERGQGRIDDAALEAAHEAGDHTELVDGCPGCQAETDAETAERDDAA